MTVEKNMSSESTSSILDRLVPGTEYRIEIAATTAAGTGNFSSTLIAPTLYGGSFC